MITKVNNKNTHYYVYSQVDNMYVFLLIQQRETIVSYPPFYIFNVTLNLFLETYINIMPILLFDFIHLYCIMKFPANIAQEIMQFDFSCTFPSAFSISINNV